MSPLKYKSTSRIKAIVALGSNLGDRYRYLLSAEEELLTLTQCSNFHFSSIYQTAAMYNTESPDYLNAVVSFDTDLTPHNLLKELLAIENQYRRERAYINAPRTLDLDLLFYGSEVIADEELTIPHPRLHERFFVLTPLVEICPTIIHPLLNKTVESIEGELHQIAGRENYISKINEQFLSNR
jgi:2-amino-4-hydroxy-6-hydroxymethyldihydropteridine diphosphokinase